MVSEKIFQAFPIVSLVIPGNAQFGAQGQDLWTKY